MKMLLEFKAGKWSRVQYYTQFVNVDVTSLVLSAFGIERLATAYLADDTFAFTPFWTQKQQRDERLALP